MHGARRTDSGATSTAGLSPDDASFLRQLASCSSRRGRGLAGGINPVFLAFELPDGRRVQTVEELRERPRNAWFTYGEGADEVAVTGLASEGAVKGKLDRDKHPTYWIGQAFRTVVARIEREQNARACESLLEARLLAETRLQAFEEQQAKAAEAAHECAELQARLHA
eukprot:1289728-Prymnesium_polylepis.1